MIMIIFIMIMMIVITINIIVVIVVVVIMSISNLETKVKLGKKYRNAAYAFILLTQAIRNVWVVVAHFLSR